TVPVLIYSYNRYFNFIGNVLGRSGYHTSYQCNASSATDDCTSAEGKETEIWSFGFSGNQENFAGVNNDTLVAQYVMRWGNFDVVNNTARFVGAEVPSALSKYANPLPGSQTLPPSFYLTSRPAWWSTSWGTPSWPAIGPDVSNGTVTSGSGAAATLGGHVQKIPARLCHENTSREGGNPWLLFNASSCYSGTGYSVPGYSGTGGGGGGDITPPSVPTNLRVS
ncbi:MAG: hypothetical protein OEV08_15900, partial [Nitrospira sp.]|nr:hypothetical protein [Nitrospira sp.]